MSLDTLIHRYLGDRAALAAGELDALIAGLRAEPARAVALREQLLLDDLLAQKLTLDRRNFTAQVGQRVADYERGQEEMDSQVADLRSIAEGEIERPAAWSGNSAWVKCAVALAAAAVIAVAMVIPQFWTRGPQPVAKVTGVEGEVAVAIGEALLSGQRIETPGGGSLSIEYADRTTVQIAGGSAVLFDIDQASGAKRVTLDRGELFANVAPQRAGAMVFSTPHATATVLGTQLRLTVGDATTLLDVTEGKVRLDRLAGGQSVVVAAHETALASTELLQIRSLSWPENRDGLMYLISPLGVLDLPPPAKVERNPVSGGLIEMNLELTGNARFNEETSFLQLQGGYAQPDQASIDHLPQWRQQTEFTLEVVVSAADMRDTEESCLVALGPAERPNFALSRLGEQLVMTMHGADDQPAAMLELGTFPTNEPIHLVIVYGGGLLTAYRDGEEVARGDAGMGLLAGWKEGPLTVGADAQGNQAWHGTVEAMALYSRAVDAREIERSARNYAVLAGRGEKRARDSQR